MPSLNTISDHSEEWNDFKFKQININLNILSIGPYYEVSFKADTRNNCIYIVDLIVDNKPMAKQKI